jgi:hypothetical protein
LNLVVGCFFLEFFFLPPLAAIAHLTFVPLIFGLTDFFFGGHISRQFKSRVMLPELPGSVAGVYKWFLTPGRWRVVARRSDGDAP